HQILEAILLHTDLKKQAAKEKTLGWLQKVKLPDTERIYNAYPHQLSGGQLQRIMIAMAMSCEPDLLIADEPTTGLDVTVQKEILQLMRDLQKETDCAIFFISHDLGVIREIADEVLVMQKGKIVERGQVKTLFESPKHPYTQGLIACRPPLDKRLKRLPVIGDFLNSHQAPVKYPIEPIQKNAKQEKALLQVDQLAVQYSTGNSFWKKIWGKEQAVTKAVDSVSFEIFRGETIGLVGESGCGKTTLGKAILQLIPHKSGQVKYGAADIFDLNKTELKAWRKQAQIIFQDPYSSLNPSIKVGSAIAEVLKTHGIQEPSSLKERTINLLRDVGLESKHYNRYPEQLSGGQRQRVCIARALAVEPEFIVCDEPVSALDVSVQAQVLNLLKDLQEKYGFTYLFISHDFSVIRFMCDRLMVMNKGKIIESGYTDEVLNAPKEAFTKALLEAVI
ncbi:MAG TPA: ABC transporter ATP-binding protein, partial [Saprospiraceae bacterium]|nr:ABC transporter ATP-binding protein [Saprospiraceae bacterium]